jgi:hypothetical protein
VLQKSEGENVMTTVEQIQVAIQSLPLREYTRLKGWFTERDWKLWDQQIEKDSEAGKLDFLIQEALTEKARGRLQEL